MEKQEQKKRMSFEHLKLSFFFFLTTCVRQNRLLKVKIKSLAISSH